MDLLAAAWRADGWHGRDSRRAVRPLLHSMPAHDRREIMEAQRAGAAKQIERVLGSASAGVGTDVGWTLTQGTIDPACQAPLSW